METDLSGLGAVKIEGIDRLADIRSQFIPGIALGENGFREALRAIAVVRFLGHLEDQVFHTTKLREAPGCPQAEMACATLASMRVHLRLEFFRWVARLIRGNSSGWK